MSNNVNLITNGSNCSDNFYAPLSPNVLDSETLAALSNIAATTLNTFSQAQIPPQRVSPLSFLERGSSEGPSTSSIAPPFSPLSSALWASLENPPESSDSLVLPPGLSSSSERILPPTDSASQGSQARKRGSNQIEIQPTPQSISSQEVSSNPGAPQPDATNNPLIQQTPSSSAPSLDQGGRRRRNATSTSSLDQGRKRRKKATSPEEIARRKEERAEKVRAYAADFRKKQRKKMGVLEVENGALRSENAALRSENGVLTGELQKLMLINYQLVERMRILEASGMNNLRQWP